jgi:uncharacterized protein with WD repeat
VLRSLPAKSAVCSPDGTKLAAVTDAGVDLFDLSNGTKVVLFYSSQANMQIQ